MHATRTEYKCVQCDKKYSRKSKLRVHVKFVHENTSPYKCERDNCTRTFVFPWKLSLHMKRHLVWDEAAANQPDSYQCQECGEVIATAQLFQQHQDQKHKLPAIFPCSKCHRPYRCFRSVKIHEEKCSTQPKTKRNMATESCPKCVPHAAGTLCDYHAVAENARNVRELAAVVCPQCSRPFQRMQDLKGHCKERACADCGVDRIFNCQWQLTEHRLAEHPAPVQRQQCEQCAKWFANVSSLMKHKRIHTGEKPFKCHMCGLDFGRNDLLQRHLATHSKVRKYKCDECDQMFFHARSLTQHMLVHQGVRFRCDACDKSFSQNNDCMRHIRTAHADHPGGATSQRVVVDKATRTTKKSAAATTTQ